MEASGSAWSHGHTVTKPLPAGFATVTISSAAPLTTAYWKGGFVGGTRVWAFSNGSSASNWSTSAGGPVSVVSAVPVLHPDWFGEDLSLHGVAVG